MKSSVNTHHLSRIISLKIGFNFKNKYNLVGAYNLLNLLYTFLNIKCSYNQGFDKPDCIDLLNLKSI